MKMKKKKNNSNPPYEEKLATTCAPKIQKKKSIANANLLNQIIISSNGHEKIKLFKCQHKKRKSIEKSKGKCIMELMDVAEATCHFNCPFQDDIIMEILYRLPIRDLVQFKCVSKLWNALISDPYFVNKHLDRAKNDPHSQKLLIYQLQTGYSLGLGYDSTSGDYKILNIHSGRHGSKVPGEIFSLKSGSWRTIDNHPRGIENLLHCSGSALALVNDAFHWVCISGNYFDDSRAFSLVSFSISKEVYADIPLPGQLLRLGGNIGIGVSELDGMLCAYSICEHQRKRTFKLWVLKDYGVGECNYLHLDCVIGIGISELDGMLCAHSICEHQRKRTFKLWVLKDYGVGESWIALFVIDASDILRAVPKYRFADGEVLFLSTNLLGKPTHSFWTSRGSFGMCYSIRGGFAFTESLISPKSFI
ncbi:F-box protein like [Capsicum annuum]